MRKPWGLVPILWCGLGALAAAGGRAEAGDSYQPFTLLPESAFFRIAGEEAKFIEQALAKGQPDKKTIRAVKAAAWRVAASAEIALTDQGKFHAKYFSLATLGLHNIRHDAVALMAAVDKGDFDRAKKLVAHLTPGYPKSDMSFEISKISVTEGMPLADVMFLFSSAKLGGAGVEALLDELADKKELTKADLARLHNVGAKITVLANLLDHYAPAKDDGDKTAKAWLANAADFRNASTAMTKAAAAGKNAEAQLWLGKLTMTCLQCHDTFRG